MTGYTPKKKHAPVDADVQLPAAIRAAANRSSELHKQYYEDNATDPNAPPAEPTQSDPAPKQGDPAPAQSPAPEPAQAPADPNAPVDWEHKYNSIKGRYDRQETMLQQLNQRVADAEARAAAATRQPAPQPPAELSFKALSQEERETFGDDFIDVAARAAQERLSPEFQRMRSELDGLKQQLGGVTNMTLADRKEQMYTRLTANIPSWREINRDAKFIAWLNLPDTYSGAIRLSLLREAFDSGNAERVENFFKGFLKDEAATDPARSVQPVAPPKVAKVPLESFAAPGRAKAPATTDVPGEKETITVSQITEFYRLVNSGHYRGNEAEKDALEKRIFAAQAEGRVV